MNRPGRSKLDRKISNCSPISTNSIKEDSKQSLNIADIYNQLRQKISEMQSAFKFEHLTRQRQLLRTYVKVLDQIGSEVMKEKEKYLNLDKQSLKTDKRLQIVTELNTDREQCRILVKKIKRIKQQIKQYENQNHCLEKEVQAMAEVAHKKNSLYNSEHLIYQASKQMAKSSEKRRSHSINQEKTVSALKKSLEMRSPFDIKARAKSFMINSEQPEASTSMQGSRLEQSQLQQKYLSNRRKRMNKYLLQDQKSRVCEVGENQF